MPIRMSRRAASRPRLRLLPTFVLGALLALVPASIAAAHVTVNPSEATKGGFATLTFRVPNESDTASTTQLQVVFPDDVDLSMRTKPVPGWEVDVEMRGDAVASITWSGGSIAPGEFQEFDVSGGPMPEDADSIQFGAIQTYDDGEVVRWVDPVVEGAPEPEHPAPTLHLVDAAEGEDEHGATTGEDGGGSDASVAASASTDDDDGDGATPLAVVALVLGVLGAVLGTLGFLQSRRSR
jgi:uncharacterized protein YcnI